MLPYKSRRRLSLLVLLVGLPVYIVLAVSLTNWLGRTYGRQPVWVELAIYVGLGFLWMLPLRKVFLGVGQADPDAPRDGGDPE